MSLPDGTASSEFGHPKGKMQADGSWLRNLPNRFALKLAIAFGTADAAVLYTVPAGKRMLIERTFYEVVTGFTGGSSSTIGLSSSSTGFTTKGDLLGDTAGDATAVLGTAGLKKGAVGNKLASSTAVVVLEAGTTIRFDRITSAYTAGAGFVHVIGQVVE